MARGRKIFTENRNGSKATTDENLPLNISKLHKNGSLAPGARSSSRWWRGEDKSSGCSISIIGGGSYVRLVYTHCGEPVDQRVSLTWTPCHYGGARPWWVCGGCHRRVGVIYGAGKYFACRHCYQLCYKVQKENPTDRALRRAFKIREQLGDDGGLQNLFPQKPKWMRWKTYSKLAIKGHEAERQEMLGLIKHLGLM